jgi:hypothetical protein
MEVVFGAFDETSLFIVRVESRATYLFRCLGEFLLLLDIAYAACVFFVVAVFYFAFWCLFDTFCLM